MIKQIQAAARGLFFKAVAIACALTACATSLEKKQAPFDVTSVKQIEFKIGTIKQSSLKSTLSQQDRIARITRNLADWGYPIGVKGNPVFSHTLTAEVGLIEHSETPAGFSFSSGNSDPRAIDFQKSNVLPISCELTSIAQPEQTIYLNMDFAAENSFAKQTGHSISEDKLIDHISTVCFNLLSELNWPDKMQNQPSSSFKPSWMPEVRIETVTSPIEEEKANVPGKTVTNTSEGRKQIITHNQGTPMILNFGHERR
jgi:hypothetical protein